MQLKILVLPAPLGPMMAKISPFSTLKLTEDRAFSPPKLKERSATSSCAIPLLLHRKLNFYGHSGRLHFRLIIAGEKFHNLLDHRSAEYLSHAHVEQSVLVFGREYSTDDNLHIVDM